MTGSSVTYASEQASAEEALSTLLGAVQDLSLAHSVEDVQRVVRVAARQLAGADGATFVLRDEDRCFYADEDAIAPLWKGQRFPLEACISGWAMLNRKSVAIEDIYADERIPHDAYRPTFVKSLVMVPIRRVDPLGAIGIYWAERHRPTEQEIGLAQALADSTAVAMEHVRVLAELEEAAALAETDALTGLPNRRAWDEVLAAALGSGVQKLCVALIDIDHFKAHNDSEGHQAGDELLREAAVVWRGIVRGGDIVARYGGDEFAVLMPQCDAAMARGIAERLCQALPAGRTSSIGVAQWDGREGARGLIARADEALYEAKQAGRGCVSVAA
ncbi:MAG TPA: sensor domain-containing diguanylate cyclase [Solirubrobacterales bacterium]|jgi:diguanylate cyclase (GGDEF)-like protein|nr:sensor domain-containing diguanylate cyclase [Solirubrobacterales bacterium]